MISRKLIAALLLGAIAHIAVAAPATVDITRSAFGPQDISVAPGDTVTWINHDDIPHTVTSTTKTFDSKAMDTNDVYAHTFDQPGDYAYFCAVHPFMTGIVHVRRP